MNLDDIDWFWTIVLLAVVGYVAVSYVIGILLLRLDYMNNIDLYNSLEERDGSYESFSMIFCWLISPLWWPFAIVWLLISWRVNEKD